MAWPEALQLGLIALALVAVLSILIGSLRAGISPMPSSRKAHQAVLSMLEMSESVKDLHHGRRLTLIDCGSGWGHLVFQLARRYPEAQVIGYELSFIPWLVSRLLARFLLMNNLTIYRENFSGTNLPVPLSQGDILFTYLYPKGMTRLSELLTSEELSKPSDRSQQLISICFALPGFEPDEQQTLNDLYQTRIYRYRL